MNDPRTLVAKKRVPGRVADTTLGRRALLSGGAGVLGAFATGCGAPSAVANVAGFSTRLVAEETRLDPPPPEDIVWLSIAEAAISSKNRRGRPWAEAGGPPNPVVILEIDGQKVLETPEVGATLEAAWDPGVASGNFQLTKEAELQILVFDRGALNDRPIAQGKLPRPDEGDLSRGFLEVDIGQVGAPGAIKVAAGPAHALLGVGFDVEIFGATLTVSRVLQHSPAGRAGLKVEDELLAIDGVELGRLSSRQLLSAVNGIGRHPADLLVKHASGSTESFSIGEGPCYALFDELGTVA